VDSRQPRSSSQAGAGGAGRGEGLPLEDESVDFIVFSHVIEHLYHPIQILKEACRCWKKGGKLLLSTDNGYMLGGFLNYLHPQSYLHEPVEQTAAMTFHEWRGHVRFFTEDRPSDADRGAGPTSSSANCGKCFITTLGRIFRRATVANTALARQTC